MLTSLLLPKEFLIVYVCAYKLAALWGVGTFFFFLRIERPKKTCLSIICSPSDPLSQFSLAASVLFWTPRCVEAGTLLLGFCERLIILLSKSLHSYCIFICFLILTFIHSFIFLKQGLTYLRLTSDSPRSLGCPWTPDPLTSASSSLRLQLFTVILGLRDSGKWSQGFVYAG